MTFDVCHLNDRRRVGLLQSGRNGFTMIELLIVLAILGIMAAVIIPNVTTFTKSGNLAAASDELANVKTAELGYYGEHQVWPSDSTALTTFMEGNPKATYVFDNATGFAVGVSGAIWSGISWSAPPGPPYSQDGVWIK